METVTLTTTTDGGGQVDVTLDGQDMGATRQFQLPSPAGTRKLQIALAGPRDATCVVGIAVVDGASDGDLLMVSSTDLRPVHFYEFSAASTRAVSALAALKKKTRKKPSTRKGSRGKGGKKK